MKIEKGQLFRYYDERNFTLILLVEGEKVEFCWLSSLGFKSRASVEAIQQAIDEKRWIPC